MQFKTRWDHDSVRLQEALPRVTEIFQQASLKAEGTDLIRQNDIHPLREIYSRRRTFDEYHPVLKAIGAADLSGQFDHLSRLDGVNPPGPGAAGQQPQDTRPHTEVQDRIAGLHHFTHRLAKSRDARLIGCPGSLRANVVKPEVWGAVMWVLEHPELIAAEVARQEARADEQRAETGRQIELIEAALAKCDREAQRWADAYAGEVINLAELKGYRAEIAARRQSLPAAHPLPATVRGDRCLRAAGRRADGVL